MFGKFIEANKPTLSFSDTGFASCERVFLFFDRCVHTDWDQVRSIKAVMWDCWSVHAFGFRLIGSDKQSVSVTHLDNQWNEFEERLFTQFPDIDREVIERVEKAFPGEAELVCWPKNLVEQVAASDR